MSDFRRAATTPVVLLLLLGLLLFGAWWGYKNVLRPAPGVPPTPCVTQDVGKTLASSSVTVRVYNGGRTTGLAGKVAEAMKARKFIIKSVANTDEQIKTTIVRGGAIDNPEVQLVAKQFRGVTVRADDRTDGTVDVLVGSEYSGMAPKAPTTIEVPGGVVCLPSPSAKPTPAS